MKSSNRKSLVKTRKIALYGFSGPGLAMLEYCFSSAVDCELVALSNASIIIVNGDQAEKEDVVQTHIKEKCPDSHYIVISARDLSWTDYTLLKKPHSSDDLLSIVRAFAIDDSEESVSDEEPEEVNQSELDRDNLDYYRGGIYSRKRKGEALKQKLIRGNLVVNAADRLVQQIEADLKAQEAQLQEQLRLEKEKHDAALERKKEKIRELKLRKLEEKKKQIEAQKRKNLELQKKKLAAIQQAKKQSEKAKKDVSNSVVTEDAKAEEPISVESTKRYPDTLTNEYILQCCGNASDINFSKPEERRRAFHNPEGSLLVTLIDGFELAKKQNQPVEITGLPGQLFVFSEQGKIYTTFSDDFLNQLALTRFGYGELGLEEKTDFELTDKEKHLVEGIDSFIWKVAIWTARGRLMVGMKPELAMQLSRRPDFDAFLPLPHGEEIGELWSGNSLSALDVAKILDVPQREVFAYMSGAYSLGWFQD